tara:strand:+ start:407 stop:619 length:213 start_codon:yes stop_codon:yes gene_type:complete
MKGKTMQVTVVVPVSFNTDDAGITIDRDRLDDQDYAEEIQEEILAYAQDVINNNRIELVIQHADDYRLID